VFVRLYKVDKAHIANPNKEINLAEPRGIFSHSRAKNLREYVTFLL